MMNPSLKLLRERVPTPEAEERHNRVYHKGVNHGMQGRHVEGWCPACKKYYKQDKTGVTCPKHRRLLTKRRYYSH